MGEEISDKEMNDVTTFRRIYRVETFIIPSKNNNNNNNNNDESKIFRSTEELDSDSRSGKDEKKTLARDVSLDVRDGEVEKPEFSQSLVNSDAEAAKEFGVENSLGNTKPGKRNLEESNFYDEVNETPLKDKIKQSEEVKEFERIVTFDSTDLQENESIANIERSKSYDFLPSSRPGCDLKSINESCEISYGSCEELCHHGNKNGCTVTAQSPSQVSEDIFKENWMQRLEFLRRRVSLIREKEVVLQERERLLAKKEKELKILERLVKEKIQRADLYLKRCTIRNSQNLEDDLQSNLFLSELYSRPSPPPYPEKRETHFTNEENNPAQDSREILNAGSRTSNRSTKSKASSNSTRSESSRGEKDQKEIREIENTKRQQSIKNKPAFPATNPGLNNNPTLSDIIARNIEQPKDFRRSKWSAYGSWRCRSKPKLSYDDLDSTLSADIGDSSFAVTSKKFDPRLVKKPRGFSRSASERGPKTRPCSLDLDVALGPEGERVLRKISENISAVSQSQGTRFQNYGLIDKTHKSEPKIDELVKEINTDSVQQNVVTKDVQQKSRKERSSFWNEEASDWLRKKRQAYNLATKRMANQDFENKENFGNTKSQICSEKHSRTKNENGKKFTIFR